MPRMRAARGGVLPPAGRRVMPARDAVALDGTPGHTLAGRDQGAPLGRCWLVATMGVGMGGVLPRDERGLLRSEDSGVAVHAPERIEGVRPRERFSALPALVCARTSVTQCGLWCVCTAPS